jgi:DNA/RNA non-specific endonuclease
LTFKTIATITFGYTDPWTNLETSLRNFVNNYDSKQIYVIAGRDGEQEKLNSKVSVPSHVWKVVLVLDKFGDGISDVNSNTLAFAVDIPNNETVFKKDEKTGKIIGIKDWKQDYLISVRDLEQITNYNFFSNLPQNIQDIIETLSPETIKQKLNLIGINASLLADTESISPVIQVGSGIDSTITQSGVPDQGVILITGTSGFGISQISINPDRMFTFNTSQISIDQNSPSEVGISQIGTSQISTGQNATIQVGSKQINIFQIGESQPTVYETGSKQIRSTQITTTQFDSKQVSPTQVNSAQIRFTQFDPIPVTQGITGWIQIDPSKITFTSSVTLQQLLSSHNSNLQNTTVPTWLEFLQETSPFNLNIEITDLPTGQLAEANITGFDPIGRPNAGTLYLDTDANGHGCF